MEHGLGDAAVIRCERGESDSYTSSEDEAMLNRSEEELAEGPQQPEELSDLIGSLSDTYTRWSSSDEPAGVDLSWNPDTLTAQTRPADSQGVCTALAGTTWETIVQGSVDDSFFYNTEPLGTTLAGQLGDDEYEEERNWEQEQERIKAFFEFYDDSDGEKGNEGESVGGLAVIGCFFSFSNVVDLTRQFLLVSL